MRAIRVLRLDYRDRSRWLPAKLRSVITAQAKGFAALKLLCRLARIVRTAGPFKVHFARTNALNGRKMSDVRPLFQALYTYFYLEAITYFFPEACASFFPEVGGRYIFLSRGRYIFLFRGKCIFLSRGNNVLFSKAKNCFSPQANTSFFHEVRTSLFPEAATLFHWKVQSFFPEAT